MPVPKAKVTRSRRNQRRSHDAIGTPPRSNCPQCGSPKRPHRVCLNCGSYRGREVIRTDED
jgi:large subunit ribosomal protein L32